MIGEELEKYTFEYLIADALGQVPDTIDKRQGSIIYDAIAPACYELAEYYMILRQMTQNTFVTTATGEYLDLRVAEQGMTRYPATYAIRKGTFTSESGQPMSIPIGSRFSTISEIETVNYVVTKQFIQNGKEVSGVYELTCESLGTIGNSYFGDLLPITYIQGLGSAKISDILISARDEEIDEDLRQRYLDSINRKSFGGNIAQYDEQLIAIDGIGEAQIYTSTDTQQIGKVTCSVVSETFDPIDSALLATVQNTIDPTPQGTGLGLAPIGHTVTIKTPTRKTADITLNLVLMDGYTKNSVQTPIENALKDLLLEMRKSWGVGDSLNRYILKLYLSKIISTVMNIGGVNNVTQVLINGLAQDLALIENATTQELPYLGVVTINVA